MKRTYDIFPKEIIEKLPSQVADKLKYWTDYMDDNVVFNDIKSEIHTRDHCARVLLHALQLAFELYGDNQKVFDIVAHAAIFHDSRRLDDLLDTGHGARAAEYYKEFTDQKGLSFYPEAELAIKYHDQNDAKGIEATVYTEDQALAESIFGIFKDADALDRVRMGRGALDPAYLRNEVALKMIPDAFALVKATVDNEQLKQMTDTIDSFKRERRQNKMLLIVDAQYDFINGSLRVPKAEDAMNALIYYLKRYGYGYEVIAFTVDWHQPNHSSFKEFGGEWPRHAVQHTLGAAIYKPLFETALEICNHVFVYTKGDNLNVDEMSVFRNSISSLQILDDIDYYGIRHIDICGLAGDKCVLSTYNDARKLLKNATVSVLEKFSPSFDDGTALNKAVNDALEEL